MGRRFRRAPVVILVLSLGLAFGNATRVLDHGSGLAPIATATVRARLLVYPAGRAHPEGPDADEGATKRRPPWSGAASWTGRGRHPIWRGCRHTYDPKLGRFIFSSGPASQ